LRRAASSMSGYEHVGAEEEARVKMARLLWLSAAKFTIVSMLARDGRHGGVEVADVAAHEGGAVRHVVEVGQVARVGEHVVGDDVVVGVLLTPVPHEIRADEPGSAGTSSRMKREPSAKCPAPG